MQYVENIKSALRPHFHRIVRRGNTMYHGGCAVLLYHRVTQLKNDPQLLAVEPENFRAHLKVLREKYNVLSSEEFTFIFTSGKRFPKGSVLLTFDDGYADNYYEARPILESMEMQALFYVSTGFIANQREYWWDELERILLLNFNPDLEFAETLEGVQINCNGRERHTLIAAYSMLCDQLKRMTTTRREHIMQVLRDSFFSAETRSSHRPMSILELREFAKSSSVSLGAHTEFHASLGYLNIEEQQREIEKSIQDLTDWVGIRPSYFSYPFGTGADFNEESQELCQQLGFQHAAANFPGLVNQTSLRFAFPRFLIRNWDISEFESRMRSFFR